MWEVLIIREDLLFLKFFYQIIFQVAQFYDPSFVELHKSRETENNWHNIFMQNSVFHQFSFVKIIWLVQKVVKIINTKVFIILLSGCTIIWSLLCGAPNISWNRKLWAQDFYAKFCFGCWCFALRTCSSYIFKNPDIFNCNCFFEKRLIFARVGN